MGVYLSGELDGGFGPPSSRLAYTHPPAFRRLKEDFISWARDARYYANGVGVLIAFVLTPRQYIPLGELDAENAPFFQRGFSLDRVQRRPLAYIFPVDCPQEQERKQYTVHMYSAVGGVGRHPCVVRPSAGAKSDVYRRQISLKVAPGSNPHKEIVRIGDLASEMRTAGLACDGHMLYTIFIDALPAQYGVERHGTWHLATASSARRLSRLCKSDIPDSGSRKKGSNSRRALCAVPGAAAAKVEAAAMEKADVGESTERGCIGTSEIGGSSTAAAGGHGSSAKAAEGSAPVMG